MYKIFSQTWVSKMLYNLNIFIKKLFIKQTVINKFSKLAIFRQEISALIKTEKVCKIAPFYWNGFIKPERAVKTNFQV